MPRFASIGDSGRVSTNLTVMSSTFSIDEISAGMSMPEKYSQLPPETLKYGLSSSRWRSNEKITSSAFMSRVGVNMSLEWNFTPGRRLNVYSVPSSDTSQLSARPGIRLVVPRSNSTSVL